MDVVDFDGNSAMEPCKVMFDSATMQAALHCTRSEDISGSYGVNVCGYEKCCT